MAFARQLSSGQRTAKQVHVPWPNPQKWNNIHFWKSGSKGKDIILSWSELNALLCFSPKRAVLTAGREAFSLPLSYALFSDLVTQSWYLASVGSTHWDSWIPKESGSRLYLLLSRNPSGVEGRGGVPGIGALLPLQSPGSSGLRAVSLRPALGSFMETLWLGLS